MYLGDDCSRGNIIDFYYRIFVFFAILNNHLRFFTCHLDKITSSNCAVYCYNNAIALTLQIKGMLVNYQKDTVKNVTWVRCLADGAFYNYVDLSCVGDTLWSSTKYIAFHSRDIFALKM